MKSVIIFMKSPVGRFHSSFAVFILLNLLTGLIGRTGYYPVLATVHFITGLLIITAPVVFLAISKNRRMILKAFGKMALFQKSDFTRQRIVPVLFKATALAIAIATLGNAATGLLYRLVMGAPVAFQIHLVCYTIILVSAPLHVLFGLWVRRRQKR